MKDTSRSLNISTQLRQIAEQAIQNPEMVFTTLIHRMDVNFLWEAYNRLRKDGAPGLSGKTVKEYGENLESKLIELHERLKDKSYVAQMIKRVWIEKDGGKKRPIGLLETEDKIVQKAVSMLLSAVFEQDFYPFSYGFREGFNAHQALGEIREQCSKMGINWIVDADVSGFPAIAPCIALPPASMQSFDNIDKGLLLGFIKQRVNDGGLIRLIGKWLNVGVMDGDQITYSDKGTPQGGTISPVLANIFLHYVLDEWFVKEVQPRLKGYSFISRFADDFVIGCQLEDDVHGCTNAAMAWMPRSGDARTVMEILPKRFGKYGLEIHPEKSSLISFGRPAANSPAGKGDSTFDFLGFTHYWARSRQGNWVIKRMTAQKKVRKTVQSIWDWCKKNRHMELDKQYRILCSKLRGHFQYFGVRCNSRSMETVFFNAVRSWKYWLTRRSRKKALNWEKFKKLLDIFPLPTPKIVHNI